MERVYQKWFSPALNRTMEMLVFGHGGMPVLFFPTRGAHFYDLEDWRIIEAMRDKIEAGFIQVYCVDSIDCESFYSSSKPQEKIQRHLQYETYLLKEVLPFMRRHNKSTYVAVAGCSLGGYHAVNLAFKHPTIFNKVLGMSGRYDLTQALPYFADLFDGYFDDTIYYNMPNRFIPGIRDRRLLTQLRKLDITLVVGQEDAFLPDNQQLSASLHRLKVPHKLYIWEEEAHRPRYWRQMVKIYL